MLHLSPADGRFGGLDVSALSMKQQQQQQQGVVSCDVPASSRSLTRSHVSVLANGTPRR
jgi:hypothetical protein